MINKIFLIGVFTMLITDIEGVRNTGIAITIGGAGMLCFATLLIIFASAEDSEVNK